MREKQGQIVTVIKESSNTKKRKMKKNTPHLIGIKCSAALAWRNLCQESPTFELQWGLLKAFN